MRNAEFELHRKQREHRFSQTAHLVVLDPSSGRNDSVRQTHPRPTLPHSEFRIPYSRFGVFAVAPIGCGSFMAFPIRAGIALGTLEYVFENDLFLYPNGVARQSPESP